MIGANEYYDLFDGKSQQIGRLFLQCRTHARGKCFEIFLLPEGAEIKGSRISGKDNVCIYGVTGGQLGWTETYGWLHTGKWKDDFLAIVEDRKIKKQAAEIKKKIDKEVKAEEEKKRINNLLSTYS